MPTDTTRSLARPLSAVLWWLGLAGSAVTAIVVLHETGDAAGLAVDWSNPWTWAVRHSPERVLLACVRTVALALAYWVALSMLLYTAMRACRFPGAIRSIEWMTLPLVRRTAERAVAVALTISVVGPAGMTGHAAASAQPPIPVPVPTSPPAADLSTPPDERDPGPPSVIIGAPLPPPLLARPPAPPPSSAVAVSDASVERDHHVASGDSLWIIARDQVAGVLGRDPAESEIATYWTLLIETNGGRIRSGDPDLIFPGEVLVCPPTADVGISP